MNLDELAKPFPPERISWRVGSTNGEKNRGLALAYIDSRDVQIRLDEVCGIAGWQCSYPHAGQKTVCRIEIKIDGEWVGKEDGAGDSDVEAEKGALSDAFKRAAVKWGIGRYLYDLDSPWVALEPSGRSYKIKESEYPKLRALLSKDAAKASNGQSVDAHEKNPPGRHRAITDVRAACREVNACTEGDQLLALIGTDEFKAFAFKICCQFPNDWLGPEDNSGLSGVIASKGLNLKIHDETDNYVNRMERARDERSKK